jgi:hypothetical protein
VTGHQARWRGLVAGALAALAVGGCSPNETPDHADPTSSPTTTAPLADRDPAAVRAALRQLDLCKLLLAASKGLVTPPAGDEPRFRFPSYCGLGANSNGSFVAVEVSDPWRTPPDANPPRQFGGATGYPDLGPRDIGQKVCEVYLPVSPTTAITVHVEDFGERGSPCGLAESLTGAVAEALAEPDRFRAAPRWDPCDALKAAHGNANGGYEPQSFMSASCSDTASDVHLAFRATTPGASGTEEPGASAWASRTVAGTTVWFSGDESLCSAQWSAGPIGSPYTGGDDDSLVADVQAPNCAEATKLVKPLIAVLKRPPPDVAPQRPLLYPA